MHVDYHANYDDDDHDHNDDDDSQVIAWMRTRTTPKWNYTAAVEPSGRFILSRIIHNFMIFITIQHHSMTTTSTDITSIQVFVPPGRPHKSTSFLLQKWEIVGKTIVNRHSGHCLDIA